MSHMARLLCLLSDMYYHDGAPPAGKIPPTMPRLAVMYPSVQKNAIFSWLASCGRDMLTQFATGILDFHGIVRASALDFEQE